MIARVEQAIGAHELVGKLHRQRQGRDDVEPDLLKILAGRPLEIARAAVEHGHLMIEPADDVRERAAEVRAD